MQVIYTASIHAFSAFLKLAGIFGNKKAQLGRMGRRNWAERLVKDFPAHASPYWFHAASLGEFEQARPLIERIKEKHPTQFILLTFFSPSGYQVQKNYKYADLIYYLPLDTPSNARQFIALTKPKKVFFIKYEFWFNFLQELKNTNTPTYLISGIFREKQHFFQSYGKWFSAQLSSFSHFFLQNKESENLLKSIGYENTTITGDTRLDRVAQIVKEDFHENRFSTFSQNTRVIVFGSSWQAEEDMAIQLSASPFEGKILIAPHEINHEKIARLKARFTTSVSLLSETDVNEDLSSLKVLIIDKIGLLSTLYRFAFIAFIGGGFGKGIHNTLEAVVYKVPVIFGPNYAKFQEAVDLIKYNAGFCVQDFQEFYQLVTRLSADRNAYQESAEASKSYVLDNLGATDKVLEFIEKTD